MAHDSYPTTYAVISGGSPGCGCRKIVRGKRYKRGKSVRRGVCVLGCRPEGGGPPLTLRLLAGDVALGGELFEGGVDALAADMAVKEGSYLIAG